MWISETTVWHIWKEEIIEGRWHDISASEVTLVIFRIFLGSLGLFVLYLHCAMLQVSASIEVDVYNVNNCNFRIYLPLLRCIAFSPVLGKYLHGAGGWQLVSFCDLFVPFLSSQAERLWQERSRFVLESSRIQISIWGEINPEKGNCKVCLNLIPKAEAT
jgi:hypothetical protein